MSECTIQQIGKFRNGSPRYWCTIHKSIAKRTGTGELLTCQKAHIPDIEEHEKVYLDPEEWKGGVGLWGSLNSIYSTAKTTMDEEGIHVHARSEVEGKKDIDGTYKEVFVKAPSTDLFNSAKYIKLDSEIATGYTASMVTGKKMKCIECSHCGEPHIDSDYFAVTYHRKHLCTYCGKQFWDEVESISNPIVEVKKIFGERFLKQSIELVDRKLRINQAEYPGGIEIWGSNPAIIWTRGKKEEAGIHVHVYKDNNSGERIYDDTFGSVIIDGIELNDVQVRYLMVQNSLSHLNGKVKAIQCDNCGGNHFDTQDSAIRPHKHHLCEYCSTEFETSMLYVSNPLVKIVENLIRNYEELQKK